MAIACPYCEHRIPLRSPRPGRYRHRCPVCERPFTVFVPVEAGAACHVRAILSDTRPDNTADDLPPNRPHVIAETLNGATAPSAASNGKASGSHLFGLAQTTPDPRKAIPGPTTHPEPDEDEQPPRMERRGYVVERELGRGGMGAVYLARQVSLDRLVALKVMGKRWASDAVFVARFTREAYAAAQLSHPNIVAIHDIGEVDGHRFFSMEYVRGAALSEVLKRVGKFDAETAVGYVLQAARGLKHAHDRGLVHRDVKPDNLLLDDLGLVKVADLGLVKDTRGLGHPVRTANTPVPEKLTPAAPPNLVCQTPTPIPHTGLTGEKIALGTPAYMSPEQCRDAAKVDRRADVYSLGCTLYVLLTGRPPFDGNTAVELMSKHAYEPLVPPEQVAARVPRELSAVIQRMMAKEPADRFQDMGEVIRTLEAWLGVRQTGTFTPREDQIGKLETYAVEFNTAAAVVLRERMVEGFVGAAVIATVCLTVGGQLAWAFGVLGLVAQTAAAYFLVHGLSGHDHLFTRVRQYVSGLSWWDWAAGAAVGGVVALLLATGGVFWHCAGFGLVAVAVALGTRFGLDRAVERQRRAPLDGCERLLRKLRSQGLDEEELRQFVAKFAGPRWEEFFESLFGYEAKLATRAALVRPGAVRRERYAAWRDLILAGIDRLDAARKEARERELLLAVELARLQAAGVGESTAKARAAAAASALVREAGKIRNAESERIRIGPGSPANVAPLTRGSSNPEFALPPLGREPRRSLVSIVTGQYVRAVIAAGLLAGWVLWACQNGLLPGTTAAGDTWQPLVIRGVPAALTTWADGFNVALAGLALLVSLFYRGSLMAVFVLLGAVVAVGGHRFGVRPLDPLQDYHVALALGSALALVGLRLGRRSPPPHFTI